MENANPMLRISAARQASLLIMQRLMHNDIYVGYARNMLHKAIIDLLPSVTPRYLSWADRQIILQYWPRISADAASLHMKEPYKALQLFELGRGIIFGHILDCRTDETGLKEDQPDLYRKFQALRGAFDPISLDHVSPPPSDNSRLPSVIIQSSTLDQ